MTARLYLVRHAAHDLLDKTLCGRMPGVPLNEAGRAQAAILGRALRDVDIVQSSPRERCVETANAIAAAADRAVEIAPALDEIDMGEWTGRSFPELAEDPRWRDWNERRAETAPPNGESMRAAQQRIVEHARELARTHAGQAITLVTHADVVKAALAAFLRLDLAAHASFTIAPASISLVLLGPWGARVDSMSETAQRWSEA